MGLSVSTVDPYFTDQSQEVESQTSHCSIQQNNTLFLQKKKIIIMRKLKKNSKKLKVKAEQAAAWTPVPPRAGHIEEQGN